MFSNVPKKYREAGTLNASIGDLVELNPMSMMMGGGIAIVVSKGDQTYKVKYIKNGYETVADDYVDIVRIVSKAK